MTLITLDEAKHQCSLELDFTEVDTYLQLLINAAVNKVENSLNKRLVAEGSVTTEGDQLITPALKMAILLLVGHWYTNREAVVTGTIVTTVPLAYESLISPYCEIAIG